MLANRLAVLEYLMRRQRAVMVLAAAAAVCCAAPLAAGCASPVGDARQGSRAGTWHAAIEVPGTGRLNKGGNAMVNSVSCASAGNCAAGGQYTDASGHLQAFVVSETNGTWHAAAELPGTAALNKGGLATVNSVSCASAGNCAAGGQYTDNSGYHQAFVASETNGTWHAAIELPGTAALNKRGAGVHSVSCASAGNCAAGGSYKDGSRHMQAFIASETNGTWRPAIEVPGTAALNTGGFASVGPVSCASAGNCLAGGSYDGSGYQAFVASEQGGTWHAAIEVPGTATLNTDGSAAVVSVSCTSAGTCAVGGYFTNGTSDGQAFVASESNGTWRKAIEVPGTAALNAGGGGGAEVASLSCPSPGNCTVGGFYTSSSILAFVASETNGAWRAAIEAPGTGTLNKGEYAAVLSVSCASAGNCAAGGSYISDGSFHYQAFVASESNGAWQAATELPGTGTLDKGGSARVASVSCAPAGTCSVGGSYTDRSGHVQAFVASQT
jgi:hypothetical protein